MSETKYSRLVLPGALILLWLLLFAPLLLGRKVLPWDAVDQFYPTVYYNVHQLRLGLAPWWNPYIYSGYPQAADPQGMLFSPLLMAWMLLPANPSMIWFDWGVLLHLLLGGAAVLALVHRRAGNRFGALLGAMVFMAGGVASARLEHVPIVLAYAYAPLVLLTLERLLAAPSAAKGLYLGLAAGAMSTQLVQLSYLWVMLIASYAVIGSLRHWPDYDRSSKQRWLVALLLAAVLALMMALPQVLWSWVYITVSNRPSLPLQAAAAGSLDSRALWTLLDPNRWHALRGNYDGPASKVEGFLYIGALPTLLIIGGLRAAARLPAQRRQLAFFGSTVVVASVYMFGVNTPVYGWLYDWLPGLQLFRRPSDGAYVLNFALAMIAGMAATQLPLLDVRKLRWLVVTATLWLTLTGLQLRGLQLHGSLHSMFAALAAALLGVWLIRPAHLKHAACGLLLILLFDYRSFNLNGAFSENRGTMKPLASTPAARFLSKQRNESDTWRIETEAMPSRWDNGGNLLAIGSTQGYNPLRYGLYDDWYGARESTWSERPKRLHNHGPDSVLSALLGLRYLVRGKPVGRLATAIPSGYRQVFDDPSVEIWRNDRAYPAWLLPTSVELLAPGQELPETFEHDDLRISSWLTPRNQADWQAARLSATQCNHGGGVRVVPLVTQPSQREFDVESAQPSWLVLNELDFPGWQADLDAQPLPIHRANGMFRAVCVPAGHHRLSLGFSPWAMFASAWRRRDDPAL